MPTEQPSSGSRALLYLGGIILSTIIAGTATAPFAAYHFNRFQVFGVVANMVAIPTTSFWVMPWAIVAAILMPLHLEGLALVPMAWGVEVVLWIARVVAAWPGAVVLLPPMPVWGLSLITIGGIWLCLWRGSWRLFGLAGIAAGGLTLLAVDVPDLMIDGSGRLTAARTENDGLVLSSRTLGRSTRLAWLQRAGQVDVDGPWPGQTVSADGRLRCDSLGCVLRANGHVVALVHNGEALPDDCHLADVIVSTVPVRGDCRSATTVIDRFDLWRYGTHALWLDDDRVRIESVDGLRGQRPWVLRQGESTDADADDEMTLPLQTTPSHRSRAPSRRQPSVAAEEADQPPLHLDLVRSANPRFVGGVGRLESDGLTAPPESLERNLLVVDERDDDRSAIGDLGALDDHRIAIENACLDHRIALDLESVMITLAEQDGRHLNGAGMIAQCLNRRPGGDLPIERERYDVRSRRGRLTGKLEVALDDGRREPFRIAAKRCRASLRHHILWQAQDLESPRAVWQPPDEAAFFQTRHQPMDS